MVCGNTVITGAVSSRKAVETPVVEKPEKAEPKQEAKKGKKRDAD